MRDSSQSNASATRDPLASLQRAYEAYAACNYAAYASELTQAEASCASFPADDPLQGELLLVRSLSQLTDAATWRASYRRASQLIGGRSRVLPQGAPLLPNWYNPLVSCLSKPGIAKTVCDALDECAKLHRNLAGGGDAPLVAALCRAQLAFYQGNLEDARMRMDRVMVSHSLKRTDLMTLGAVEVLMNLAKHDGSVLAWQRALSFVTRVCEGDLTAGLRELQMAQLLHAMALMSVGVIDRIPTWVKMVDFGIVLHDGGYAVREGTMDHAVVPTAFLASLEYLAYTGHPSRALVVADEAQKLFGIHGMVIYDAYFDFLRACCWRDLGDTGSMRACLDTAVDRIAPDELWVIASEFESGFGAELHASVARYGEDAVQLVRERGSEYWTNVRALTALELESKRSVELTEREREIARMAAEGLTNGQIAEALHLGERTVKYHLLNAFEKLGIDRRVKIRPALEENAAEKLAAWMNDEAQTLSESKSSG